MFYESLFFVVFFFDVSILFKFVQCLFSLFTGWKGRILAKLRTKTEFRSAVTFACPSPIIHIIPGKIGADSHVNRHIAVVEFLQVPIECSDKDDMVIFLSFSCTAHGLY